MRKFDREETKAFVGGRKRRMKSCTRAERGEGCCIGEGRGGGSTGGGRGADRWSDLSRLLISEKTDYESRAIVYYRERNGWDYSCCVKLNRPPAASTIQYVMWI